MKHNFLVHIPFSEQYLQKREEDCRKRRNKEYNTHLVLYHTLPRQEKEALLQEYRRNRGVFSTLAESMGYKPVNILALEESLAIL